MGFGPVFLKIASFFRVSFFHVTNKKKFMEKNMPVGEVKMLNNNLFVDGFQFYKHQGNILRCSHYKKGKCPVRLRAQKRGEETIYFYKDSIYQHNHLPDRVLIEKSIIYEELKKKAQTGINREETVWDVAEKILSDNSTDKENKVLSESTCAKFLFQCLKDIKEKEYQELNIDDFIVPLTATNLEVKSEEEVQFFKEKMTIFANKDAFDFFKESNVIFCDGTFEKKKKKSKDNVPEKDNTKKTSNNRNVTVEDTQTKDIPMEDIQTKDIPMEDIQTKDIPMEEVPVPRRRLSHSRPVSCSPQCLLNLWR